jgi:hypothetical protein
MPYLTLSELKTRSSYSAAEWAAFVVETDAQLGVASGTAAKFAAWLEDAESEIDDTLRRRYAVPFGVVPPATEPDPAKVPRAVKKWAASMLDEQIELYRRIPGSTEAQDEGVLGRAARARAEMQNAANPDVPAHPELPLAADKPETSGVTKGGPHVVSYQTGFDYFDTLAKARSL